MIKRYYTIGMAGHIDHGKTTLTKALTNIDTDRLKEEKERQISIELGFAPLYLDESMQISIVDVPGHERFIRQMIAGVAGIDLVLLVIAADEGVMPQTKEHLEILSFLGVKHGIIVLSKIDNVEDDFLELVIEDIKEQLEGTVFANSPIISVDSISKKGILLLKDRILESLKNIKPRNSVGAFRLPIDQVFTVKGQGTVVRGTIYEGQVQVGEQLTVLPSNHQVRVRHLQVHHEVQVKAIAGQRAALNLSGVTKQELKRGDVLVSSNTYVVTDTIDISLHIVHDLKFPLKQRSPIKCYIGTAEVMGKIVFFDRNEVVNTNEEILCQLRLDNPIVTKRGDRFILRRPTPVETVGGGWVIDANGKKYRFGEETKNMLLSKKEGTPKERILKLLGDEKVLSFNDLIKKSALDADALGRILSEDEFVEIGNQLYSTADTVQNLRTQILTLLHEFHQKNPMKFGINKAELLQQFLNSYPKPIITYVIENDENNQKLARFEQYIHIKQFEPQFPIKWSKRINHLLSELIRDSLETKTWDEYIKDAGIPKELGEELKHFLLIKKDIFSLDQKLFIHKQAFEEAVQLLRNQTSHEFEIKDAKDILRLSRKYLIPLLELLDNLNITKRVENKRIWMNMR